MVNSREKLDLTPFAALPDNAVEWRISDQLVPYPDSVAAMEARAAAIAAGEAPELVWLLEHPPLYTPAPRARRPTCWKPAFRYLRLGAAARSPIMAPASGSPTSCWT